MRAASPSERTRTRTPSITAVPGSIRDVGGLDALRGVREIAERDRDAARGSVGEERHDPDEADAKKDKYGEESALRLVDARCRHEHGEETRVLPRGPEHTEDAVVVLVVRRHVLDKDISGLCVHLRDARKLRVRAEVDGRGADLAIPDEREVGI